MKTFILFFGLALAACSPYSPSLGNQPFSCGSDDPPCPDGYDCMTGACVQSGASAVAGPDAGMSGCPDKTIEPNNSYSSPFPTPVASQLKTFKLTGVAICPAGDIDVYALTTTGMQTLTASVTYDSAGPALDMQLLDSNGMTMKNGTGTANTISASVADLPASTTYYVFVQAGSPSDTNGYSLEIDVSP
jgi:hypothetical protein